MTDRLTSLTSRLRDLGAPNPESWAQSELAEDIPQTARYVALRRLWPELIQPWRDHDTLRRVPATKKILDAGVDPAVLSAALCSVAYEAVAGTLWELWDQPDDVPHGRFVEVDEHGNLTGRSVDGLHESLLSLDPSGNDGSDFL
ncbi:hypothetical protein ACIRON_02560 [Nocardioides sp. NPDC101246]|uniref:hypothetical protein n=1 Tax=Nocardioides sp. NPDC101246 TaxID=3364336 RepID=UPI00381F20FF